MFIGFLSRYHCSANVQLHICCAQTPKADAKDLTQCVKVTHSFVVVVVGDANVNICLKSLEKANPVSYTHLTLPTRRTV